MELVRFAIYAQETGGQPLWQEVQQVEVDDQGRYSAMLGSTTDTGISVDLFAAGEPRWLGTEFLRAGEVEQPRTLATSVPYALHAARAIDADTLGGRPASAYLLADPRPRQREPSNRTPLPGSASGQTLQAGGFADAAGDTIGTANFIGKFINTTDVRNSVMFESAGRIGVNTTTPLDSMHVRFGDTTGTVTGVAVQNTSAGAASYSGMLFYDQSGALGQFQGFNNSTHEYRINNIAAGGSINFMLASTSQFRMTAAGDIGVGLGNFTNPGYKLDMLHNGTGIRTRSTAGFSVVDIDAFTGDAAIRLYNFGTAKWLFGNRPADNGFYFFEFGSAATRMVIEAGTGRVVMTGSGVSEQLAVAGNVRVGGTTGCVLDNDSTVIAGACVSDLRFKKDVTPFTSTLDRLVRLTPVHYYWRADEFKERRFGTSQSYGLIAQDVVEVFPDLVKPDAQDYLTVNYSKLPLLTLQAVKELKTENDALKAQNAELEQRLSALEAAVASMRKP